MQTPPNTGIVRAKATITFELSLFGKFGGLTTPEFGRGTTVGGDPEGCQWIEGDLHVETSFDSLHTWIETSQHDERLLTRPYDRGLVSRLLINKAISASEHAPSCAI